MKSKVLLALLILIFIPLLSGCTSNRELNTFNLVTSVGIDKDESGYLVTYQVLNAKAVASQAGSSELPFVLYSEKGEDLGEIERRATMQSARNLYFTHTRAVVIGEDVAKDGLKEILDYLYRSEKFRTDYYFIIAKDTTAKDILGTVTSIQTISGMQLFESIENTKKIWAPTNSSGIIDLVNDINSKGKNASLAGVGFLNITKDMTSGESLKDSEPGKIKLTGMSVFKEDKLVGWLDEDGSIACNYILGEVKNTASYVEYDNNHVSLNLNMKKTKIKVSMSDGKPVINVHLSAEMTIATVDGDADFTKQEELDKLNTAAKDKMIDICKSTVDRAQHDYNSDIFGFGESIHKAKPKVWEELKDNWDTEFPKLQVDFYVESTIKETGENMKSIINDEE